MKTRIKFKERPNENIEASNEEESSEKAADTEHTAKQNSETDISKLRRRYFKGKIPTNLDKNQMKIWVMKRLVENIPLFSSGSEVIMPELFGPLWSTLSTGIKRQASKEFKIAVAQTVIQGIIFLKTESGGLKKRNASIVYRKL